MGRVSLAFALSLLTLGRDFLNQTSRLLGYQREELVRSSCPSKSSLELHSIGLSATASAKRGTDSGEYQ